MSAKQNFVLSATVSGKMQTSSSYQSGSDNILTDSIFSKMDIVKIIESYGISLKRDGDVYYGSIPPVGQTGKSLHVSKTNTWYCHKNHVGGGILDFIGYMEKGTQREAYLKACEISGILPAPMAEEEINKLAEKEEINSTLTAATNIYHGNLTEEIYNIIFNLWGITKEVADEWNLGYSSLKRDLRGLNPSALIKTGLVYGTNSGSVGGEFYNGRIIFSYAVSGKVQYMAGRETPGTLEREKQNKSMKYKYMRLRSEENKQISEFVSNNCFFGEDKIKQEKVSFIVEGLADCIVLNQFGFPAIALGSTKPAEELKERLVQILKNKTKVYLCPDNDENKAGEKGALAVGRLLLSKGIEAKVIELIRGEENKIDIAEFMKGKSAQDFKVLISKATRFVKYALSTYTKSESKVENLQAAEEFTYIYLLNVDPFYRDGYIADDVKNHFGLVNPQVLEIIKRANSKRLEQEQEKEEGKEDAPHQHEDNPEGVLLESLEIQEGKGLLACEMWVNEFKIGIAKIQPEMLNKKLVDPKEKKYSITVSLLGQLKKSSCYLHMKQKKSTEKYLKSTTSTIKKSEG